MMVSEIFQAGYGDYGYVYHKKYYYKKHYYGGCYPPATPGAACPAGALAGCQVRVC